MRARRGWLALLLGVVLIGGAAAAVYALPEIVRRVAVARIHAATGRPVSIEAVELNLLTGRVAVRGFRLAERDQTAPFADFDRLEARLHLPSLLRGRIWIRDLSVTDSTVRVVRLPTGEFNFSDLIQASGTTTRPLDVTVDHFALAGGTVTLEDRALAEPRTWTSEQITIEARNVSTRRDDGSAIGRSLTAGAPVSLEIKNLRLYPIHLQATMTIEGADLTPLQVYVPPAAPIVIARGRASTTLTMTLDAREGIRADATGRFEDVALVRPEGGEPFTVVPKLTAEVSGFGFRDGDLQLMRLAVDGAMSVRDASMKSGDRYPLSTVRASVSDLTWPARTPGRLDVLTSIPGGGTLAVVRHRPAPAGREPAAPAPEQPRSRALGRVRAGGGAGDWRRGGGPESERAARRRRAGARAGLAGRQSAVGGRRPAGAPRRPARRGAAASSCAGPRDWSSSACCSANLGARSSAIAPAIFR